MAKENYDTLVCTTPHAKHNKLIFSVVFNIVNFLESGKVFLPTAILYRQIFEAAMRYVLMFIPFPPKFLFQIAP